MFDSLFRKTSIRTQMLVAMLLVGAISMVLVTIQSLHCAHEGLLDVQTRHLAYELNQQRNRMDSWVEERANTLRLVGHSPSVTALLGDGAAVRARDPGALAAMQDYVSEVQAVNPYIETLAVFDPSWTLMVKCKCSPHTGPELLDDEMQRALEATTEAVWSRSPHIEADGRMTAHMGYPVLAADGRRLGYLVANIELDLAIKALYEAPESVGAGAKAYLIDPSDGRYLTVPSTMSGLLGQVGKLPAWNFADEHAASALAFYRDGLGTPVIGMAVPMPRLHWLLVAEMDESRAFAMTGFLLERALWCGVVVMLLIGAISLPLTRLLARPLQALTDTCQRIAAGAPRERVIALPGREAEVLATTFNSMLDRLAETQKRLVQAGSLAAVGELSASIVHEMRNPINTIQMNLDALRRKVDDDPTYVELYHLARRQTQRLQHMLNSLLTFGKPLDLSLKTVDLRPVVEELARVQRTAAETSGVTLRVELPDRPVVAALDAEQVYRALANLVENAVQAQTTGGDVVLSLTVDGGQALLRVADHGPGITEGLREKIFRPFFTTREAGTGLGLSIVRKIVDLHNGSLDVESTGPDGTTFIIRLPLGATGETLNETHPNH